jgi:glucan phosphoethanolaminetransferase (alkaline phosphatase superfamily)
MNIPKILLAISVCLLPVLVVFFWAPIKAGSLDGLFIIGANICAIVILLVYIVDRP